MIIFRYIVSIALLLSGMRLIANEGNSNKTPNPICRLIVNEICDTTQQSYSVQLLGSKNNILYNESHSQDTLYLSIVEVGGNKYHEASIIKSPNDSFHIYIDYNLDTAKIIVDLSGDQAAINEIQNPGLATIEPLMDIDPNIYPIEIPLKKSKRNIFTINSLIRHLNRDITEEIEFAYPNKGSYRCLKPFWLVKMGKQKWFETDKGVMFFIKPANSLDSASIDRFEETLSKALSIYSKK